MYASLAASDVWIILIYFGLLLTVGLYYSRRDKSTADYFLAGKRAGWLAIGSSLFAANISSGHFIGLAGAGASLGIAAGNLELIACFMLLLLGWFIAPLYMRMGLFTVPEFLERRFGRKCRMYIAAVSLVVYGFTKISVTILAGGFLLHETLGWDMATSAVVIVAVAGIYATAGGLNAIIRVDILQTALLITGASILTIVGLNEVGGFSALRAAVPEGHFHLLKSMSDPAFPWTGILLGAPVLGAWYWCMDQYMVQRVLAAGSIQQARGGSIFAGFLKLLPVAILILPGIIVRALYGNGDIADQAFPLLVTGALLPAGLKGLVIAGLLAALISSLASGLNSSSALFTMDLYKMVRRTASDQELVLSGRLFTAALVILSLLAIPFIRYASSDMYSYILSVQAGISPPVVAVFIGGMLWKGGTRNGARAALISGGGIGIVRLTAELLLKTGHAVWRPAAMLAEINFLHFAFLLFVFSIIVLVAVSSARPEHDQNGPEAAGAGDRGTVYPEHAATLKKHHLLLSLILVAAVMTLYIIFH